jgi:hypothetical protein
MIEYLPLAITSIKAAKEIATSMLELRDLNKIKTATSELNERLIEAIDSILATKEQFLAFQARITEVEKENDRLKDWSEEKNRYTRRPIAVGVFAYIETNFVGLLENAHKYCCNCFDKTSKSTLQQSGQKLPKALVCPNGCPPLQVFHYIDE